MIIDLNFTSPEFISISESGELDEIVLHIRKNQSNIPIFFMSEEGYPLVNITITSDIPVQ